MNTIKPLIMRPKTIHPICFASSRKSGGFTLLELVITILILSVLSVGTIGYQYLATRMASRAKAEITVTRTARLILDNWKKTGGDENFDLSAVDPGFTPISGQDKFRITVDGLPMVVSIEWQDMETDNVALVTLRQIQTKIQWRLDHQAGEIRQQDPDYIMATYVRRDESGG
jgi:prepilin-type N-terminal cleavage/methylation domain-containing protein